MLECYDYRTNRHVFVKYNTQNRRFRLLKEYLWLKRLQTEHIAAPLPLRFYETETNCAIVLSTVTAPSKTIYPQQVFKQLYKLYTLPLSNNTGWGHLRADESPRWKTDETALHFYCALSTNEPVKKIIQSLWNERQRSYIHGDLHRANICGRSILDWEGVSLADPYEDAARFFFASQFPEASCAAAWGANIHEPRWVCAMLLTALESAAWLGPRQEQAQHFLERSLPLLCNRL